MADRITLVRAADLLSLELEPVNLAVSPEATRLIRVDDADEALIIVHFPPQAIAEHTTLDPTVPPDPPIRTALAGPSRLVFRVPEAGVELTAQALLDWRTWEPVLAPTALPRGTRPAPEIPPPAPAAEQQTAIEFPWRLVISADAESRWDTDLGSTVSSYGQLWSAQLNRDVEHPPGTAPPPSDVRALSAFTGPEPFPTPLGPGDRADVVQLSSNFHLPIPNPDGPGRTEFVPAPVLTRRLELTTLGANADLEGRWEYPLVPVGDQFPGFQAIDLQQWQHTAGLGRDTFVRTVRVGFLCTGNKAVVIETTQRIPSHINVVAELPEGALFTGRGYLVKTVDVVVLQPRMDYAGLHDVFAHDGRELPLRSLTLTTTSARIQQLPKRHPGQRFDPPAWLMTPEGGRLMFQAVGTDVAGKTDEFSLPLMFVPYGAIAQHSTIRQVFDNPPAPISDAHRIDLRGQSITIASPGSKPGSTTLTATALTYDLEQPTTPAHPIDLAAGAALSYVPGFIPRMAVLNGTSPAIDDLLGKSKPVDLSFDDTFLGVGLDAPQNPAQVFVRLASPVPLALPSQRGGGIASTHSAATALSRTLGPVSKPDALQTGTVDLSAFAKTKILGTIPLLSLLPDVPMTFDAAGAETPPTQAQLDDLGFHVNPPRLITRREPSGAAVPDVVETRFVWKPPLRDQALFSFLTLDLAGGDLLLDVTTRLVRGGSPSVSVYGRLRNPKLVFAKALAATISELTFRAEAGKKLEFGAKKVTLEFQGPLEFVRTLQSILPDNGFDDPPYVTADAQGVVAGYTLAVPNVGIGIFSLQNIAISAALSIPFTDRPAGVRFALCERHKPFLVTVSLFGGGGFFAVEVSANGLEAVEASLEFGGSISLNLGVASGGVYVMAGVYFGMKGKSVELTGYLRCGGHLSVLGLISISLEFYLAFTYRKKANGGNEIFGQASLSVSVKIAFFSTSVTLSIERHFAGSDGDPSFADSVTTAEWARYLQAYAS